MATIKETIVNLLNGEIMSIQNSTSRTRKECEEWLERKADWEMEGESDKGRITCKGTIIVYHRGYSLVITTKTAVRAWEVLEDSRLGIDPESKDYLLELWNNETCNLVNIANREDSPSVKERAETRRKDFDALMRHAGLID